MTRTHITQTGDHVEEVIISHPSSLEEHNRLIGEIASRHLRRFLWIEQILWFVIGVVELLLGMELLLKFIGASMQSPFARFMADVTHPFVAPFVGLTHNPETAGRVIDVATLSAMVVYLIGAALLDRIMWFLIARSPRTSL